MIFGGLRNAGDLLSRNARNFPSQCALIFEDKSFTWIELETRARAFARSLIYELNLEVGDRVALYARNSNQWVEALFGLAQAGLVSVTINYRLTADEASYIIQNSETKAVICDESTKEKSHRVKSMSPHLKHLITPEDFERLIDEGLKHASFPNFEPNFKTPAMLLYTSGTTGFPKGALYTHGSLLIGMFIHVHAIGSRRTHRVMLPSPLYSAAGIAGIYCAAYVASQISLINFDVETACKTIERDKITFTNLVPTTMQIILNSDARNKYDLSSLKVILYGGSPISESLICQAMSEFSWCKFRQTFATTETGCAGTVLEPDDHLLAFRNPLKRHLFQSCGKPQVNVDVKLVNEDWQEVEIGEIGEIAVKTEANMAGYWKNETATAQIMKDGWIRTGDMAKRDLDGYFYLVDRKNDLIVTGALNVYPSEVEKVIQNHPAVQEVAVIGVPSEKWGEEIKAVIVLKEGQKVGADEIIKFCEDKLAGFKKPKSIEFIEKLPRNPTGKILRRELKERFSKQG